MLLGIILSLFIGSRQIYTVNHHPDWLVDGVRWSERGGYKFVAVYLPETAQPKTIIVDRGECQCVSRPYWDNVYRRGDWVDVPIEVGRTGDTLISLYIVDPGQFPHAENAVVQNLKLSELPQIDYINAPFLRRSRRRPS